MPGLLCAPDREDMAVLTGDWLLRERFPGTAVVKGTYL